MGQGYQITHPKLDCSYSVLLNDEQLVSIENELAQLGEGKQIKRMSDLPIGTTYAELVEIIRELY